MECDRAANVWIEREALDPPRTLELDPARLAPRAGQGD